MRVLGKPECTREAGMPGEWTFVIQVPTFNEVHDVAHSLPLYLILGTVQAQECQHTWPVVLVEFIMGRDLLISVFRPYVFLSHFVLTDNMKEPDDQDTSDGGRSGSRNEGKLAHKSILKCE